MFGMFFFLVCLGGMYDTSKRSGALARLNLCSFTFGARASLHSGTSCVTLKSGVPPGGQREARRSDAIPESSSNVKRKFEDQKEPGSFANIGSFQIRRPLAAIPFLLLGLLADLGGSMRFLLSLNPEFARQNRLDGIYAVSPSGDPFSCGSQPSACMRRYYGTSPLSATFTYPGDWVQDPTVDMLRQKRSDEVVPFESSQRDKRQVPLPVVAVNPIGGTGVGGRGVNIALYARRTRTTALLEALGTPEEASQDIAARFAAQYKKQAPTFELLATKEARNSQGSVTYEIEMSVRYADNSAASVWTTALFLPTKFEQNGYVLLLTGVAPMQELAEVRAMVRDGSKSLALLLD